MDSGTGGLNQRGGEAVDSKTAELGKCRVYACKCGYSPMRPLCAEDTIARPFPKPCDHCGNDLADVGFSITDAVVFFRDLYLKLGS